MATLFDQLVAPKLRCPLKPAMPQGATCPKCGYAGPATAADGEPRDWRKRTWLDPESCERYGVVDENGRPVRECIMVTCVRCGYRYREDVEQPEAGPEPS